MAMTMDRVIEALKNLPEGSDINDAIDYLIYLEGIEEEIADMEAGRFITDDEMLETIKSWAK